ncbi:MAG: isopentenyl-diphosphate Delta-isomerase [Patescibacteria group bacterium]|jgi:isopentenyl-diphosphate delta-isomerase
MEQVVLVNKSNRKLGTEEKLEAHKKGLLHRAFSVFVFNNKGELLLQKRHSSKYHSGGLWSNTVCSHPRPGERYISAVHRRLHEEVGFDCPVKKIKPFIYRADFDDGLIENEYDVVFIGKYNGPIHPDPAEIETTKWISLSALKDDILRNPQNYTFWFKKIIKMGIIKPF